MKVPVPPISPTPLDSSTNRDFVWKVIGRYDTYIGATNTKAAGVGALVAFVLGTIIAKWTDLIKPIWDVKPVLFIDALFLVAAFLGAGWSLMRSIQAVNPNVSSPQAPGTYHSRIFFGHVAAYSTPGDYLKAVREQTAESALEDSATQAHTLAAIAKQKFEYLEKALWWLRYWVLIPSAAIVVIWALALAWNFLSRK